MLKKFCARLPPKLNPRYPEKRLPACFLLGCAFIATAGLFVFGVLFAVFATQDTQSRSLKEPLVLDSLLRQMTFVERFNSIGVLKSSVVEADYDSRWHSFMGLFNGLDSGRLAANEIYVPLIAFTISKIFGSIMRDFLELRYSAVEGISMKRLLLHKAASDPLYLLCGDRMPKIWDRGANALQLNSQINPGLRALPGLSVFARLMRVRVALGLAFGYNVVSLFVDLAGNYGSAGILREVDPVGGNSNFTLELMPKYQMVYEPVEFVGLRKCTQFRMQVAGVVGGSDELVNAFMACGTYYEVVEDVSIGSNVDARNICTWSADSNPKSPAGKRYRWGGIEVYIGNSACEETKNPQRGNLNIRFKARNYGLVDGAPEMPNAEAEFKIVGVSLTVNPFTAKRQKDPQVSFNNSDNAFESLAEEVAKTVARYNDPALYEAKRGAALQVLLEKGQIPDTAAIELTEAIAQNIFFSSEYEFVSRTDDYCDERKTECLGVHVGITNTRRAFAIGGFGGLLFLLLAKLCLCIGTQRFYLREISTVFDDAIFSSLAEQCASDYTEASETRVSRGWTREERITGLDSLTGTGPCTGPNVVVHYSVFDSEQRPAGARSTVDELLQKGEVVPAG